MLTQDFKEFIALLIKHQVEYLVVGGYAVGIHGHPRYTGDLDIWLNLTEQNSKKIYQVIQDFGFGSLGLTQEDFMQEGNMIQLGYPPLRIDLLNQIDGVTFEECIKNKKVIELDDLKISFIGYEDLLKNKKASGRLQDLSDFENLTE